MVIIFDFLKKVIESRFYHKMDVYIFEDYKENNVTKQRLKLLYKDIKCFLFKDEKAKVTDSSNKNDIEYLNKICFGQNVEIKPGSVIHVDVLGNKRQYIMASDQVRYKSHCEILVKRKGFC
ncbi:MAG: hypothetical protein ACRCZK_07455 [Oscillospiraceae bacterium]